MRRRAIPGVVLLGIAALSTPAAATQETNRRRTIAEAAITPLRDALARNATSLCADFVPSVAAALVADATSGDGCQAAAERVFAETAPNEPRALGAPALEHTPKIDHLDVAGTHATITIGSSGPLTVKLE